MTKMDAATARVMIWEQLRKVARPDSRFSWDFAEFITDYEGSDAGAQRLAELDAYASSDVVFVTPDNNLEGFRERVIRDGKTLIMTNYGISRGFFIIRPGDVPTGKEELASTLDGVQRYWTHRSLAQLAEEVDTIGLLVSGASAITPSGIRFGKGHGYFDLEWAMLCTKGLVDPQSSVVVAAGHDCQVVDVDVTVRPYDTAIDLIVTPTRTIETRNEFPKPTHGVMWYLLEDDMLGRIPPLQELWAAEFCR